MNRETQGFSSFYFCFDSRASCCRSDVQPIPRRRLGYRDIGALSVIEHRPFEALPGTERDWLRAKHHFRVDGGDAWGALVMWNDDEIAPDGGFAPHAHANMEIVTYVWRGAISHQDSLGNRGRTVAGDVQVMSAGAGIRHSEFNLESEPTQIFQIWIKPARDGGSPAWGTKPFPKQHRAGRLVVLASGYDDDAEALPLRVRARVLGAALRRDQAVQYDVGERRYLYLAPAIGRLLVNGLQVEARDGVAIKDVRRLIISAASDSEFVLVDAPEGRSAAERPIAGGDGARYQGRKITEVANKLHG
jgi:redox-sensitive bicupin YhaK (pirin superfamily)